MIYIALSGSLDRLQWLPGTCQVGLLVPRPGGPPLQK